MQVRNLTQSNVNSYEITSQIQQLWGELELQNQSIIQIQNIVEQSTEFKSGNDADEINQIISACACHRLFILILFLCSGSSSRRRAESELESLPNNDREIYPKDTHSIRDEQKRDTLGTGLKKLKSNSEKKYSHRLGDLIDENI